MGVIYDLLGLGAVAVDELAFVDQYPPADAKVAVRHRERRCGGLAATALVAASRLGCCCGYAGVLGVDEPSRFAGGRMEQEGIDLSHALFRPEARVVQSFIVVDRTTGTRNIFFDMQGVMGADPLWPPAELIRCSRVLLVDHLGVDGMVRAARVARQARVPVVADLEDDQAPRFGELLELVDHLLLSREFATRITGTADPATAVRGLWHEQRRAVVVTCGRDGCWYAGTEADRTPQHLPAFAVEAVDTTGCGDVFHGAYAAGLAQGLELGQCLRLAAAAAALKASRPGGQESIPNRAEVEQFLLDRNPRDGKEGRP